MDELVTFMENRNGGDICAIAKNGKIGFPFSGWNPAPKPGEVWRVQVAREFDTYVFLRPVTCVKSYARVLYEQEVEKAVSARKAFLRSRQIPHLWMATELEIDLKLVFERWKQVKKLRAQFGWGNGLWEQERSFLEGKINIEDLDAIYREQWKCR